MSVAPPPAGAESSHFDTPHMFVGRASMHRIGRWRFPVHELVHDGESVARMGRTGWFKIFIGRGQRIELPDGAHWTVKAIGVRGAIRPLIVDSERRNIAIAGSSHGTYGINGKSYGCALYPAEKPRFGRANRWILREHEDELAIIQRSPLTIEASLPVHLGAVLLSFVLVRYGLPEDSVPRVPPFYWK